MHRSCLPSSAWYKAITLAERSAALHVSQGKMLNGEVDMDLAEQRLQRWRLQSPFAADSRFVQRLDMDNVSEEEFLDLLGELVEAVRDRFPTPPPWLVELDQAFSRPPSSPTFLLPETLGDGESAGFLHAIEPLMRRGRNRLQEGIQELVQAHTALPFDPDTIETVCCANLPGRLNRMLGRTMVLYAFP